MVRSLVLEERFQLRCRSDVSNGDSYAKSHIENAIHIPTKDFLDGAAT